MMRNDTPDARAITCLIVALAMAPLLVSGCTRELPVDVMLHLNLAGDATIWSETALLEIRAIYADGSEAYQSWDSLTGTEELTMENVMPGDGVVFEVVGWRSSGTGGEVFAYGLSDAVDLTAEGTEVWVLYHRTAGFIQLDGGSDVARIGHEVVPIDGGALVIGGYTGAVYAPISQLVRTEEGGYALEEVATGPQTVDFSAARIHHPDREGEVFIGGGGPNLATPTYTVQDYVIFDPETMENDVQGARMNVPRQRGRIVGMPASSGGAVVLLGGYSSSGNDISMTFEIETIDPSNGTFVKTNLGEVRIEQPAVAWGSAGHVAACGGFIYPDEGPFTPWSGCDDYDVLGNTAQSHEGVLQTARAACGMAAIGDAGDRVLVVGGTTSTFTGVPGVTLTGDALDTAEIIDAAAGFVSVRTVEMVHPRVFPLVVGMPDVGQVLVCGGYDGATLRADCEVFDEDLEEFVDMPDMVLPYGANAIEGALLDDGSVLLVGGNRGGYSPADFALLYQPYQAR